MKRFLAILLVIAMLPIPATFAREAEQPAVNPETACADVWETIETIEAEEIVAKRGKNATASDYIAIVDDVITAVEASDTFVEGSIRRNGAFFTWETTDGVVCGYSPRLRARIHNTAIEGAAPEDYAGVETTSYAARGGSPTSTEVAVFQPYYGLDSSFKTTYSNEGRSIAQALGGTSNTYKTTSATIDAIADAFERCAVVIFDSHGDTDYANPSNDEDFVSRANTSYICLQTGTGLTAADQASVTGTYGSYYHAYYAGSYGSMQYYCVDGTAIANHMENNSPNGMLWSAICLGMATDGLHAALRAKGVEVAYGYSQSVTFDYDYQWEEVFWDNMIEGKTVAQSAAAMKSQVGDWDYITEYTTISSARSNFAAFPIFVSSEDVYPGKGNVDNRQTVNSTWMLKDSTTPTEATEPTEPTEPISGDGYVLTSALKSGDQVIIYNPGNGKALTAEMSGYYLAGADVAPASNAISNPSGAAVWTVTKNANGTYSFKSGTSELGADKSGTYTNIYVEAGHKNTWTLETCNAANHTFYVYNAALAATYEHVYLEWYGNKTAFSAYDTSADRVSEQNFGFQFYVKNGTTTPTEPTDPTESTEPTTAPTEPTDPTESTEPTTAPTEPISGNYVAIFNPSTGKVMTTESYLYNNKKTEMCSADATLSGGKLTTSATNVALFEMITSNGVTTFKTADGKYLEADGTNVQLVSAENENTKFVLEASGSDYFVRCNTAQYQGKAQYIELYRDYFTLYGMGSDTTIFTFNFYPLAGGTTPTEPTDPTESTEPTTAPTDPTTEPTEPISGNYVAFYNPAAGKVMTTESYLYNNKKTEMCSADATLSGGKLTTSATNVALFEMITKDGVTTFKTADGKYLEADGTNVQLVSAENENTKFVLEASGSDYFVRCNTAQYQGKAQYIELYRNYFTLYGMGSDTTIYTFNFYPLAGSTTPTESTEPTTAPTDPTTEPTTAPIGGDVPIAEGDCVVIYNAASGVIIGYDEDTDYDQSTGNYTYCNISTEAVTVSGSTLKADFNNAGTFYVIANADGTYAFLDQYDYDQSEDPENPTTYFITAEAPDTYYDSSADYAAFEVIPVEGGYLLKNVADGSYYAIENGVVVAKDLVAGDPSFIFRFAIWDGTTEGESTIVCTLVNGTTTPTEPTDPTESTEPTTVPTEPTEPISGNYVAFYNPAAGKVMTTESYLYNNKKTEMCSADATLSGGKLTTSATNVALFEMITSNGVTTFKTADGKYLEADGTNVQLVSAENENTKFVLEASGSDYFVRCNTAQYQGKAQYVELYRNYFTLYGMGSDTTIYTFNFYPLAGSTQPTEPTDPTESTEPTTAPTDPTTAPTEPTTAPTEPTTAPTEPTTAPTESTEPIEPIGEYKVTVKSDNPEHGRVTIVDNVVTATPDNGYYPAGFLLEPANAATVLQSGNFFYISNVTANCVLTIQFREKERAELHFSVPAGCSAKRISTWIDEPTALKAPEGEIRADLHEYKYLGWTEGRIKDEKEKPVYYTDFFTPQEALTTLYALYTYEYRGETFYTTVLQMKTCLAKAFHDVDVKAWYHEALDFVLEYGYMNGVGDFKFDPNGKLTRGMMVTILYRLEEREGRFSHPFTDVKKTDWYSDAVAWAYESGIVNGTSTTTFSPDAPITREQTAAMLYRYAKWNGEDVTPKGTLMNFVDANKVSAFARDPMRWAVGEGIIHGKGKIAEKPTGTDKDEPTDILDPLGTATRAEIAQILYGWLN